MKLPRKVGKEKVYLSHEQVELLAANSGDQATLVQFLAYTGLRWGEVTALRVSNLDSLRRRINVTRNAVMVGGTIHEGTPKSHESRSLPFPAFLSAPLAKLCEGKSREDLIFGDGHTFLRPPDVRNGWWVRALASARQLDPSIPPSLTRHDLRHTAASLAVSAGANVKAVQRMLGHASAAMTLKCVRRPLRRRPGCGRSGLGSRSVRKKCALFVDFAEIRKRQNPLDPL